ncbi:uncharacterized protein DS421_16g535530 [Arachis hypogaea]|nr:uncharacterized protein DS421_16g535530 [Arachis hypogaea]
MRELNKRAKGKVCEFDGVVVAAAVSNFGSGCGSLGNVKADEITNLLDCTSWSGAGPGLMDDVIQGAFQVGPVGGFKF